MRSVPEDRSSYGQQLMRSTHDGLVASKRSGGRPWDEANQFDDTISVLEQRANRYYDRQMAPYAT